MTTITCPRRTGPSWSGRLSAIADYLPRRATTGVSSARFGGAGGAARAKPLTVGSGEALQARSANARRRGRAWVVTTGGLDGVRSANGTHVATASRGAAVRLDATRARGCPVAQAASVSMTGRPVAGLHAPAQVKLSLRFPTRVGLLVGLATLVGCGAGWRRQTMLPGVLAERQQVQVWHRGLVERWHAVVLTTDSVRGIPFLRPVDCDSCRITLPIAEVDSVRTGSSVRGFWRGTAVVTASLLSLACVLWRESPLCWVPAP
jgi:hypothetical protein